uniref:Uncharacterized protein n=1 Tax=Anguilla anguilla TaxID=7936 RepID=A0A0E9UL57_ANGAN
MLNVINFIIVASIIVVIIIFNFTSLGLRYFSKSFFVCFRIEGLLIRQKYSEQLRTRYTNESEPGLGACLLGLEILSIVPS